MMRISLFLWIASTLLVRVSWAEEPAPISSAAASALIAENCVMCHSDAALTGGLTLEAFDPARPEQNAPVAEKIIRKLRTGMMPPSYAFRPSEDELQALASALETSLDDRYHADPFPGRRTFQRLNRVEYQRSVEDLLDIEVDVAALLPPDTISHSFDNIADVQGMSPTLLEGYLRAAGSISRDAVGDLNASASETTHKVPRTASQLSHVEGAPFGTRGGLSLVHNFPADGDYVFRIQLHASPAGFLYGSTAKEEQVEVSVNGKRVALLDVDPLMTEEDEAGMNIETEPIALRAGPHRISAAFLTRYEGPIDDVIAPIEHTLADSHIGIAYGITTLPHLRDFTIQGPYDVTGVSDTPSRRKIFLCRPVSARDELPCATEIIERLASRAYRRPVDDLGLEALMSFYVRGRERGDFESGIRMGLQAILASPSFVFRLEDAVDAAPSEGSYRIGDFDLASRLSFFLWASSPDDELIEVAAAGRLAEPEVIEQQVRRMLADPRSDALSTRFASQWLRLQDLSKLHPDALRYPQYDARLAASMKRETELLFDHLLREDRSVLDLLTADYTFVDERLAQHYEIPNVSGSSFRRVALEGANANRPGVLGHGSTLALTSVANRTSPVQRGKWVMEVLLGSPPPPPPPNVPALEETAAVADERVLSIRERMETHRENPACNSCHTVIDPIGLSLENFDVTGAWRDKDGGAPVDPAGELYDGTALNGPLGLRDALLSRSEAVITSFTESLLTYAIGRRVEYYDMPAVRRIAKDAARNGNRMSSFVLGVVKSPPFLMSSTTDVPVVTDAEEDAVEQGPEH